MGTRKFASIIASAGLVAGIVSGVAFSGVSAAPPVGDDAEVTFTISPAASLEISWLTGPVTGSIFLIDEPQQTGDVVYGSTGSGSITGYFRVADGTANPAGWSVALSAEAAADSVLRTEDLSISSFDIDKTAYARDGDATKANLSDTSLTDPLTLVNGTGNGAYIVETVIAVNTPAYKVLPGETEITLTVTMTGEEIG
jgi:hypothetical protein